MSGTTRKWPRPAPGLMALAAALLLPALLAQAQGQVQAQAQSAATPGRAPSSLLLTHAEARRRLPNTVSDASVTVEVHGRDLRATAALLARQSQSLLGFLRGQTVERLQTEAAGFTPEMQEVRNAPDRIKGYTGTQTISFRTTPDQLPMLLAGSLDNGATSLSQPGSSPREEEVEAARADLVSRAAKSAMAQAQAAAAAVGQRVTGVERLEIDPQAGFVSEPMLASRMLERPAPAAVAMPAPPIATEAGQATVTAPVLLPVRLAPAE